jgi:uncharacterized protein
MPASIQDPFLAAIQIDDVVEVERYLAAGRTVTERDNCDRTPLHVAAGAGALRCLDLLLARGAPLEAADISGGTPLITAVGSAQTAAAARLLAAGALMDYTYKPKDTPEIRERKRKEHDSAMALARKQYPDQFKLLDQLEELSEPGEDTVDYKREAREIYVKCMVDPREIHAICCCQDLAILQLLVEGHGADVNVVQTGKWVLNTFAAKANAAGVAWLLQHGAQPDLTHTGATALHAAVARDSLDCAQLLLKAGADPNQPDVDGQVALSSVNSEAMLDLMLSFGADPTIGDQCGFTPSHWVKDPELSARLKALQQSWSKRKRRRKRRNSRDRK